MNKYKKLAFNTVIFAIGSFSSKIFSLLLNNLYTKHFSPSGFYTKTLLDTLLLFLLPIFTFSITEAVVRYGLDNNYDKKQVFTTGAAVTVFGLSGMLLCTGNDLPDIGFPVSFVQRIQADERFLVFSFDGGLLPRLDLIAGRLHGL